uniref:Cytokine receptor family member b5 like n=1 Tax=Oncorhynchus mykiss TaxID=8022 RepID=I2FKW0_ONCMY|nr:cytokine receptor family member b5 like precursor [Oncorhynchus mykiss]
MKVGFALVLLWSLPITNVLAELPQPQNLTLLTLNTQYVLTWDWDQTTTGNSVSFTVEYMAKYKMKMKKKNWSRVCERTTRTRCDLTGSDLHYLGMYVLRVRASADGVNSGWVNKDFCPDIDASLGPPSRVELAPVGNLLDVTISDPLTSTQHSMKEHVLFLYYRILKTHRTVHLQEEGRPENPQDGRSPGRGLA